MKFSLFFILIIFTFQAQAYTFDKFIGDYEVVTKPVVKNNNAGECIRFAFADLQKVSIEENSSGYHQTHVMIFSSELNTSPLQSYHPISEFRDQLEDSDVTSYADTTGGFNYVQNEKGYQISGSQIHEALSVGISHVGGKWTVYMREFFKEKGVIKSSCQYHAEVRPL